MYHNVSFESLDRGSVNPLELRKQLEILSSLGFRNVSIEEMLLGIQGVGCLPGRCFAITFDDARSGVHNYAIPILRSLGYTATLYPITDFIGTKRLFSYQTVPPCWISEEELPAVGGFSVEYMTNGQIRDWLAEGHSLGGHTMSHQHLTSLSDEPLDRELGDSVRHLRDVFGQDVSSLAYPYGEHNLVVRRVAQRYYRSAVTVVQGDVRRATDPYCLRRLDPGRRGAELVLRLWRLGLL